MAPEDVGQLQFPVAEENLSGVLSGAFLPGARNYFKFCHLLHFNGTLGQGFFLNGKVAFLRVLWLLLV